MTSPGETIAPADPPAPPDWATIASEFLCPLCDYNLRGLVEPRCPECGHPFTWVEIFTAEKCHPFLFEHHPERNIRSLIRTYFASVLPWRFWKGVLPTQQPVPRRLILYWFILILPTLVAFAGALAITHFQVKSAYERYRAQEILSMNQFSSREFRNKAIAQYGSVQNYVNHVIPIPSIIQLMRMDGMFSYFVIPLAGPAILWPWMTFAALMIFRESMFQARIKPGHVMRCVIYSGAIILPAIPLAIAFTYSIAILFPLGNRTSILQENAFNLLALSWLITTTALAIAYRSYLRFPHSIATLLASQAIVALAMFKLYLMFRGF